MVARRRLSRSLIAGVAVALVAAPLASAGAGLDLPLVGGGTAEVSVPALSKVSPALRQLVANGYGDVPIADIVAGHQAGHVYYLAKVTGIDAGLQAALTAAGVTVRHQFPQIGWVALDSVPAAVATVAALPQVTRLQVDDVKQVLSITTAAAPAEAPPAYTDQTKRGTHDVGADVLWADGITGKGVLVGVGDSGIDSTHPDLHVTDFVDCQGVLPDVSSDAATATIGSCVPHPGYDDNGHGTHASGIATGHSTKLPGMAPQADLAGAKVCNGGGSCLNSSVMAGIEYLATDVKDGGAGVDVLNLSLGGGRVYGSPLFGAEQETNDDPEAQLINVLAETYNVVFSIAAGNSGPTIQSVGSPSTAAQAMSVGASIHDFDLNHETDETEAGAFGMVNPKAPANGASGIASFSSRGPTGDRQIKPELTAPGSYVVAAEAATGGEVKAVDAAAQNHYSQDPQYAVLSGTSMAAPSAAGAAALVIDGYRQATGGTSPQWWEVKAALANTATTHAFEGPIAGLLGTLKAKNGLGDPASLYPPRNDAWVGQTGEGAGRIYAPSALLALTKGVTIVTPRDGALDDRHELQPNWALDDLGAGDSANRTFTIHPGAAMTRSAGVTFGVDTGKEARGINVAPASWFRLPRATSVRPGADTPVALRLQVPANAAPGQYEAAVVATVRLDRQTTQTVRIPVQFSVRLPDGGIEGPIWASQTTDYSIVGFENPEGDIYTDWMSYPVQIQPGTKQVDFSVYDPNGNDHMDVFVFDSSGQEVDSTVSFYDDHVVPAGAAYAPTTKDAPNTVSLFDGDDLQALDLSKGPVTVWVNVSDSGPSAAPGFAAYHLDVKTTRTTT